MVLLGLAGFITYHHHVSAKHMLATKMLLDSYPLESQQTANTNQTQLPPTNQTQLPGQHFTKT